MRAIPEPRRSNFNHLRQFFNKIHEVFSLHALKRRWNVHKIKKNARYTAQNSAMPLDQVANIPTGMSHKSVNNKPLLLVSFNKGQDKSPKVRLLEENGHIRSWVCRRKFKLKRIVNNASVSRDTEQSRIPTIKKTVAQHAQFKINYNKQGILKSTDIPQFCVDEPKLINIGHDHTLRIRDYHSLTMNKNTLTEKRKTIEPKTDISKLFY